MHSSTQHVCGCELFLKQPELAKELDSVAKNSFNFLPVGWVDYDNSGPVCPVVAHNLFQRGVNNHSIGDRA